MRSERERERGGEREGGSQSVMLALLSRSRLGVISISHGVRSLKIANPVGTAGGEVVVDWWWGGGGGFEGWWRGRWGGGLQNWWRGMVVDSREDGGRGFGSWWLGW